MAGHAALSPHAVAGGAAAGRRCSAGVTFYLNGGRYVTTDDAYVGAQKVLITPDISGKIDQGRGEGRPAGQRRRRAVPDRSGAVPARRGAGARPRSTEAKTSYDNLVANIKIYGQMVDLVQQPASTSSSATSTARSALAKSNFGSQLDLDNCATALVTAQAQLQFVKQQRSSALNPVARQSRSAARAVSALYAGQGRARRRPSATSITPRCARRWTASRPRSTRSSSAASSSRARRCSPSSTSRSPGSTPT